MWKVLNIEKLSVFLGSLVFSSVLKSRLQNYLNDLDRPTILGFRIRIGYPVVIDC